MKQPALLSLLLFFVCVNPAIASAQTSPTASLTVDLSSSDGHRVTLSEGAMKSMPQKTVRIHNPHSGADETYQGVELSLLLARLDAPLGTKLHGNALAMYVVAEGTDHYRAVYSLAEVDPAFRSGTVIVADRMNGQPLDAKNGPFKLVNTADKHPARCVRNLASIQLKSAPQ
jgi:hypothetical protein